MDEASYSYIFVVIWRMMKDNPKIGRRMTMPESVELRSSSGESLQTLKHMTWAYSSICGKDDICEIFKGGFTGRKVIGGGRGGGGHIPDK